MSEDAIPLPPEPELEQRPAGGLGLCLSGGGYRAMLFHVGSLWRFNEVGYLPTLTRVASVSGGSITAGLLATAWPQLSFDASGVAGNFVELVAKPLLGISRRTLDIPAALLAWLPGGAARRMENAYNRHLYKDATLQDLPDQPRFDILATDISNGVLFYFSKHQMRSYLTPVVRNPTIPLARAVAASAAFPPFLSPLKLDEPAGEKRLRVSLSDGGVYDNMGLEPILKNCATVFVSDAGGSYQRMERPPSDWIMGTHRTLITIHSQVGRLRRRQVIGMLAAKRRSGAFWAIDSDAANFPRQASTLPAPVAATRLLAAAPTRIGRFPEVLANRLINWGYAAADTALRSHVDPELPEPPGFPRPDGVS